MLQPGKANEKNHAGRGLLSQDQKCKIRKAIHRTIRSNELGSCFVFRQGNRRNPAENNLGGGAMKKRWFVIVCAVSVLIWVDAPVAAAEAPIKWKAQTLCNPQETPQRTFEDF
jgi:hypothetical protein